MRNPRQQGFSLVELMVSMAILAVLASMAMAGYRTYFVKAARAEAMMMLPLIYSNAEIYTSENGFPPIDPPAYIIDCFAGNAIGVAPVNCDKAKYQYSYQLRANRTLSAIAQERISGGGFDPLKHEVFFWCDGGSYPTPIDYWAMHTDNNPPAGEGVKRLGRMFSNSWIAEELCPP